jgi:hypothetical protein
MKKATLLTSAVFALTVLFTTAAEAQQDPPSRIEVGVQFSSITYPSQITAAPGLSEPGFGGRITLNLNKNIALEAEQNFFPHNNGFGSSLGGTLWQGHFGVKVGKRFGKFGIFAKARPGFASFSEAQAEIDRYTIDFNGQPISTPVFGYKRQTHFAMDLGGVVEFYPSRRVLTRIDVGDTIIHYGTFYTAEDFPIGAGPHYVPRTTHNFQVSAGIGFRFGSLPPEEPTPQTHNEKPKRLEVGAQFSSLGLQVVEHFPAVYEVPEYGYVTTLAGFGGRFTYNLTPNFALEAQGDFYPQDNYTFNNLRAGGRILQAQAGIKAGKRFEKFGIFAKARPGVVSFSKAIGINGTDPTFGFSIFDYARKTHFSLDVGGVFEFYPTRRIVTRFDGGDTMIFYRHFDIPSFFSTLNFRAPADVTHNFQFSAGVGFRF